MGTWILSIVFLTLVGGGAAIKAPAPPDRQRPCSDAAQAECLVPPARCPSLDLSAAPLTLTPTDQERLDRINAFASRLAAEADPFALCFAPDTPPEVIAAFYQQHPELAPPSEQGPRYNLANRWSGTMGSPKALSWSFVPDGLSVEGGTSSLFATMDAKFASVGGRATWVAKITACFARWQALTGLTYTRKTDGTHDWDDGAAWGTGGGTNRGDIRIAAIYIDGPSNVLAFDYYPENGDMCLDKDENWQSSSGDYRFLRNIIMHEHGHGIGIAHICPASGYWLMEPYLSTSFDGPQHDDIRAAQRFYGDPYEISDSYTQAYDLGNLAHGTNITIGPVPTPAVSNGSVLSIDENGEQDWFKFTVTFNGKASVSVTPKGLTYDSSPQVGQNCTSGNNVNSLAAANLAVQVIAQNGTTVLATADSQPSGSSETLSDVLLTGGPGTYYVKVYETDSPTASQLYYFNLSVSNTTADVTPPLPNPPEWIILPTPVSTTSITMQAFATDPAGVQYTFDLTGNNGHDRGWDASATYTDSGMDVNRNYTVTVKARDNSAQLNETAWTEIVTVATAIQTPASLTFGTVTDNSIVVNAPGTFTRLTAAQSGLYFQVLDPADNPVGGVDANAWVHVQTITASGLSSGTTYRFRVKARNYYGQNETAWYPSVGYLSQATTGASCTTVGDMNVDGLIDGRDVGGFVRAKLGGSMEPGENAACANYGGTLSQDIVSFVNDLLGL
jgi:hypothetical protein